MVKNKRLKKFENSSIAKKAKIFAVASTLIITTPQQIGLTQKDNKQDLENKKIEAVFDFYKGIAKKIEKDYQNAVVRFPKTIAKEGKFKELLKESSIKIKETRDFYIPSNKANIENLRTKYVETVKEEAKKDPEVRKNVLEEYKSVRKFNFIKSLRDLTLKLSLIVYSSVIGLLGFSLVDRARLKKRLKNKPREETNTF